MKAQDRGLLGDIERGALDEGTSLASLLRKCIALGGRAGSTELRDWARRELSGYVGSDELPEYRKVAAAVAVDAVIGNHKVTGMPVSPMDLPDFVQQAGIGEVVNLRMGIGTIERLSQNNEDTKISLPEGSSIAKIMNNEIGDPTQSIHSVYWKISPVTFRDVVDQVRTALTELVAEMNATMPEGQQIPSKSAADMATQYIITGKRNTVNIVNAQAATDGTNTITPQPDQPKESFWQRWRKRGIVIGIATVVAAVVGVATWLDWTPW
jgi:AbiTii-like protein